jgi:hypothetical protein
MSMARPCPVILETGQLVEHPNHHRSTFVSPLTREQEASIVWKKINPYWRGYQDKNSLNETELLMIKDMEVMQMASGLSLGKEYYSKRRARNAKSRLKKLSTNGILVCHYLQTENRGTIPIYTLGPGGSAIIGSPFTPNWWFEESAYSVLNRLIINKLYRRMKALDPDTTYFRAPHPFHALLKFKDHDFLVVVAYQGQISTDLRWERDVRLVIICETIAETLKVAKDLKNPNARFVTDYELFAVHLHEALMSYDEKHDRLESTRVRLFMPNKEAGHSE